jgi:hypothetical protein
MPTYQMVVRSVAGKYRKLEGNSVRTQPYQIICFGTRFHSVPKKTTLLRNPIFGERRIIENSLAQKYPALASKRTVFGHRQQRYDKRREALDFEFDRIEPSTCRLNA